MSRHVDALFAVFRRLSGYTRSESLEAGIQDRRVDLIGVELSIRAIGNLHFTQHFSVAPPQLSNAPEKGAIVDTAFAKSRIIVLSGDLFLSIEPGSPQALPVRRRRNATVLLRTDLSGRMQCPRSTLLLRSPRATVDMNGCRCVRIGREDHLNRLGPAVGQEQRPAKFDILQTKDCDAKASAAAANAIST